MHTDHKLLQWIVSIKNCNTRIMKQTLNKFDFENKYVDGRTNFADALSREKIESSPKIYIIWPNYKHQTYTQEIQIQSQMIFKTWKQLTQLIMFKQWKNMDKSMSPSHEQNIPQLLTEVEGL